MRGDPSARRLGACLLALAIGVAGVSASQAAGRAGNPAPGPGSAGSAGTGDSYYPLDGNGGTDVLHYRIRDLYAFDPVRIVGETTLRVRATQRLTSFHLDLLLPVRSVRVDDRPARFAKPQPHELVIRPAIAIRKGERFEVTVRYAGDPSRLSYEGQRNWLADDREVVAINEPHIAPWWFPSNDHPSDKARFDIAITTAADKQVVSNGERVSRRVRGRLATTRWRMRQPMATYLAFFAAGHFDIRRGRSAAGVPYVTAVSRAFAPRERRGYAAVIGQTPAITDWLTRELGRYPFASAGGVVTSLGFGDALENQSRPTYMNSVDRSTVVHELAHQWFGDSVSLRRWREIWLNEGFARYMEWRYAEAHGGPSTRVQMHRTYAEYDGDAAFWRVRVDDPGPADIFSDSVYDRGAMALVALRDRIGAAPFHTLLRSWVASRRYGHGSIAGFERLAHHVSGHRLGALFHTWLESPRKPAATAADGW